MARKLLSLTHARVALLSAAAAVIAVAGCGGEQQVDTSSGEIGFVGGALTDGNRHYRFRFTQARPVSVVYGQDHLLLLGAPLRAVKDQPGTYRMAPQTFADAEPMLQELAGAITPGGEALARLVAGQVRLSDAAPFEVQVQRAVEGGSLEGRLSLTLELPAELVEGLEPKSSLLPQALGAIMEDLQPEANGSYRIALSAWTNAAPKPEGTTSERRPASCTLQCCRCADNGEYLVLGTVCPKYDTDYYYGAACENAYAGYNGYYVASGSSGPYCKQPEWNGDACSAHCSMLPGTPPSPGASLAIVLMALTMALTLRRRFCRG